MSDIYRLLKKKPVVVVDGIYSSKFILQDLPTKKTILTDLTSYIRKPTNKVDSLNNTVYKIVRMLAHKKLKIFYEPAYKDAIIKIAQKSNKFINPINAFNSKSKSAEKQLKELINFLFTKYDTPKFLYSAWMSSDNREVDWFIAIAQGANVRTFKDTPIKLTKKQAHIFLETSDNYTITEAFRLAEIKNLGGDERLCKYLFEAGFNRNFNDNTFWITFFKWLIDNPMFDYRKISELKDYINHLKFNVERVRNNYGVIVNSIIKPNFSLKGRDPERLLNASDIWHKKASKRNSGQNYSWDGFDIDDYITVTGKGDNKIEYYFNQLKTAHELSTEGRKLKHCVSSYTSSCVKNRTSIWSMSYTDNVELMPKKLLTIEVSSNISTFQIVQIRGSLNRKPTGKELNVINTFALDNNIRINNYTY